MNNPHGLQVFDTRPEACDFQADHNCASCWDSLINSPDGNGGYICQCVQCKEKTRGYVTAKYVKRRMEENHGMARAAKQALAPYVPWLQAQKRTQNQNMADLGF